MHTSVRRLERAILICLLALAGFVIWQSAQMPAGTVALPGPGMMPLALGILLALTVLGIFASGRWSDPSPDTPVLLGNRRILVSIFAVLGAGLLLERIGFLADGTLFLFAMLWTQSSLGWWRSALASVAAAVAAQYLFGNLLGVVLPPFPRIW